MKANQLNDIVSQFPSRFTVPLFAAQFVTHWHSPRFHAYFPTANSYPAIVADILSGAIACIGFSWNSITNIALAEINAYNIFVMSATSECSSVDTEEGFAVDGISDDPTDLR
ncbi:hypothetical protein HUJ05_004062 [Dendroctonus ponderosae]|nr:hypothetical protein HUJ05_004062 [Dendroctonus ponderosae]